MKWLLMPDFHKGEKLKFSAPSPWGKVGKGVKNSESYCQIILDYRYSLNINL